MWNMECHIRHSSFVLALLTLSAVHCNRVADPPDAGPAAEGQDEAGVEAGPLEEAEADTALAPIPGDPLFTNLSVPGFSEAVVSVPNGATTRRPVVVVLHGSADRPDWNCDAWRHITGAHGFVLCPRGAYDAAGSTATDRRFTLRGGAQLRAHIDAALQALQERFGAYVDIDRPIVTGFSLGATEIGQLAIGETPRFPRVAQLEGGYGVWNAQAIGKFMGGGGQRVLFGCGSGWCLPPARAAAAQLGKAGVESRVVFAAVGHTNDRPLQEALMGELEWFLAGDERWKGGRR
jgi:hypothetical protein